MKTKLQKKTNNLEVSRKTTIFALRKT